MRWRNILTAALCVCSILISAGTLSVDAAPSDNVCTRLFSADFHHPGSGFSEDDPWKVADGELRYDGGDPDYEYDSNIYEHSVSPNFQYEIQAAWRGGDPEAGFGVFFRRTENGGKLVLEINHRGCIRCSYFFKDVLLPLDEWQPNQAIKPDGYNIVRVVCNGPSVKCYVNGVLALDCPDDYEYKTVAVGVIAASTVRCAFDNMVLRELP